MKYPRQSCDWIITVATLCLALVSGSIPARAQRVLGIDVSSWQGNITAANWATLIRATNSQVGGISGDGRNFVLIRSSRGGTTGYYDQNDPNNANNKNDYSQRYDDPYFVQNMNLATSAGLFAGSYHFVRPDIITTTTNAHGIANTGTDEANHALLMASPWMRPGYLPPVVDLEVGQAQRSIADMTTFCNDFSDRIYAVMGIRPMIYLNGSYANYLQSTAVPEFPYLWSARWPNQSDPNSILVQTAQPSDSYAPIYGPWDDPPNPAQPWKFWQYASTAHVNAIGGGASSCDVDVAQGGIEFLKDQLIPALWVTNGSGLWTTLSNWNSGQAPVAPVQGTNQPARVGSLTLPTPGVPGANDTVILDSAGSVTVTLSSGSQNIRKLYMRETLNITGGSLNINYIPSSDSTPISAQFSGPVTLGGGSLSVHTLQVDSTRTFTLNGGTLAFNTINLIPDSSSPAKLLVGGNITFNAVASTVATIANGSGSGASGSVDLGGGSRSFSVANGVELDVAVPISNGGLTKAGSGSMRLLSSDNYLGDTVISAGTLFLSGSGALPNTAHITISNAATFDVSGKGSGFTLGGGQTLAGNGSVVGRFTANGTVSPGASVGALAFSTNLALAGTTIMEVSRNGAVLTNDVITCGATLTFGGALIITNSGSTAFNDGDTFHLFNATTYASGFSSTNLPALPAGFRWDTSALGTGTLKVIYVGIGKPVFQSISGAGAGIVLTGTNGVLGSQYYLLSTTNVTLPLSSWTPIQTNLYGPGGSFSNNVPVDPTETSRFYLLQTPN